MLREVCLLERPRINTYEYMKSFPLWPLMSVGLLTLFHGLCFGQEGASVDKWDNQLFVGNKVSGGMGHWKFSGELQFRVKDDFQALDRWFMEANATYLISKNLELAIPFRMSVTPNFIEWRPGFGFLYKSYLGTNVQIAHQVMYQVDLEPERAKHGLRYVAFFNWVASEKLIPNAAAGIFQRWQNDFTGIQFVRLGAGLSYLLDVKHSLNFSYFLGFTDDGNTWRTQGIPFFQLIINFNREFKYLPAKYINF